MKYNELYRRVTGKFLHLFQSELCKLLSIRGKVFMLHSIGDTWHEMNVPNAAFETFLKKIYRKKLIRLEEWRDYNDFICITFDDVADSFYYNAFPLLKKYNVPFTIFVCYSLLDKEKYITTEMLKEIASCELCTVGSHGINHSMFVEFDKDKAEYELFESKKVLESIVKKKVELFAFPYGSYYACGYRRKRIVLNYYKNGFGTVSVPITSPLLIGEYFLPRINVTENMIKKM